MFLSALLVPPSVVVSPTSKAVLGGGPVDNILLRDDLVLTGCQNRLNVLERRPWCVVQCPLTGVFQSFKGVFVCQLQQTHAGLVSLLFYLVAAENGLDNDLRMTAHLSSPMDKPFSVLLDILLVLRRHMFLDRAVLVESSVESRVRTDPVSTKENLYRGSGKPDIYLLFDVLKGNGIVHAFHGDVVVLQYLFLVTSIPKMKLCICFWKSYYDVHFSHIIFIY